MADIDHAVVEPCPFCGGEVEIVNIDEGENAGGSCVSCTQCQASSNVEFGFKENFVGNWNRRRCNHKPGDRLPGGLVVVPDEPSEYMLIAGLLRKPGGVRETYLAMLDAASGDT